ncbi:MerR family transcriptional regulator [Bacillus alveayuensis]|uniref:MerR family transcriptional regulator n=1 Tax=Aeribacillus alveayuensis TaxID=279215 RepID=UPI0005CD426E|nr:MerR family transcriptional regulator [Bacillus alveayuensis]
MENKFSIGQMSKLHNVSVKTLRYYDEIDLFNPIQVDPENGYRYYSIEQFKLLDIINYLKMLGVPLKEIKKQISNRDIDDFLQTLCNHKEIMENKIKELEISKKKLEARIKEFEEAKNLTNIGSPYVKTIDERTIIQIREKIRSFYDLELSVRKLKKQSYQFASIFIGKVGFTLSEDHFKRKSFFDYSSIFLILEEVEKGQIYGAHNMVTTLPKGDYACIYFRGGHLTAPTYVQLLHDYIQQKNYQIKGDFIIRTIFDQFITKNEEEYLSEIQVQIEA